MKDRQKLKIVDIFMMKIITDQFLMDNFLELIEIY